jgi:hypothetical protein
MLRNLGSPFANPEVEIIGPQPHTRHTDGHRRPLFFRKRARRVDCVSVLSVAEGPLWVSSGHSSAEGLRPLCAKIGHCMPPH